MKKLLVSITNRSSYNKVKTIIRNMPGNILVEFLLGNSVNLYRYGGIKDIIKRDFPGIKQNYIHLAVEGNDVHKMSKTVGLGIIEVATLLANNNYDAVLTVADRFETLAVAIAASYANIPLIHLQGGERTGTIDDKVRNSITQLAKVHFPCNNMSASRVRGMIHKEDWNNVFPYGCPSMDLLIDNPDVDAIRRCKITGYLEDGYGEIMNRLFCEANSIVNTKGTGDNLDFRGPVSIIILHGDTTDESFIGGFRELDHALNRVASQELIIWNNIDPKGDDIAKMWRERQLKGVGHPKRFVRHFEPEDFSTIMTAASCIVGNSSTGIREANFLGLPSVNIGMRQFGRLKGYNCTTVPFDRMQISDAITHSICRIDVKPDNIYGNGQSGKKIAMEVGNVLR